MKKAEPATEVHQVHDRVLDLAKMVANEPSVGLFYVQQHIQRAVPQVISLRNQMAASSAAAVYELEDVRASTAAVRAIREVGPPVIARMLKSLESSTTALSALQRPSTSYASSFTRSLPRATSYITLSSKKSIQKATSQPERSSLQGAVSAPSKTSKIGEGSSFFDVAETAPIMLSDSNVLLSASTKSVDDRSTGPGPFVRSLLDSASTRASQLGHSGDSEGYSGEVAGRPSDLEYPESNFILNVGKQAKPGEASTDNLSPVNASLLEEQLTVSSSKASLKSLNNRFVGGVWDNAHRGSQSDSVAVGKVAGEQLNENVKADRGDGSSGLVTAVLRETEGNKHQGQGDKEVHTEPPPRRMPSWNRNTFQNVRAVLQTAGNIVQTAGGTVVGSVGREGSRLLRRNDLSETATLAETKAENANGSQSSEDTGCTVSAKDWTVNDVLGNQMMQAHETVSEESIIQNASVNEEERQDEKLRLKQKAQAEAAAAEFETLQKEQAAKFQSWMDEDD